jgi:hypothetical protein
MVATVRTDRSKPTRGTGERTNFFHRPGVSPNATRVAGKVHARNFIVYLWIFNPSSSRQIRPPSPWRPANQPF